MSRVCDYCGKSTVAGKAYTHSGLTRKEGGGGRHITSKTLRTFKPNIQRVRANVNGTVKRVRVCAQCIKKGVVVKPAIVSK